MSNSLPLISLKHIVKTYHMGAVESTVLNDVSMDVIQGEMLAVVGTSGSGKSTLMNIMGLLDKAQSGQYYLKGQLVSGLSDDQLALLRHQCIGFVFQQFHLLPRFTAEQNIALPLTYGNLPPNLIPHRVADALSRVGMSSFGEHRPSQLSGGQQQRVAIARALVTEPEVILADEPTGSLDSATGGEIMSLFLTLHAEGRTVILVTHDEQVALHCGRRVTLCDGCLTLGTH
ncbi:MAG: ABC transporter ATP-binding protein [Legionellales bacterium]|nr:ABC transporter ATP-binding protein [Legionellales bacterium]